MVLCTRRHNLTHAFELWLHVLSMRQHRRSPSQIPCCEIDGQKSTHEGGPLLLLGQEEEELAAL